MIALAGLFGFVGGVIGLICGIIILIDAFKNEVWKGVVSLFCWLYLLYYAFAEFQHEKKVQIILGWLLAPFAGLVFFFVFGGMALFSQMH
jgi:hypothetical protein